MPVTATPGLRSRRELTKPDFRGLSFVVSACYKLRDERANLMPWTRLDDGFIANPKILTLSHLAFRLHVSGLNWSVANMTDGKVLDIVLALALPMDRPKARAAAAVELEDAGLWNRNGAGWCIHDFSQYQESKAEVEARRRKWADQKRGKKPDSAVESYAEPPAESYGESDGDSLARPRGRPIPSHPIDVNLSRSQGSPFLVLAAERLLSEWAELTNTKPTRAWLAKRHSEAADFIRQHPDLDATQLSEFLVWAHGKGVVEPGGWSRWWAAYPQSAAAKTLPDCAICDNRRLIPANDDWTEMTPCTCTTKSESE